MVITSEVEWKNFGIKGNSTVREDMVILNIGEYERLMGNYNRLQQRYASLDQSFDRVIEENKELKSVADDYDTLCRGYGEDEISARVRTIKEMEAAERKQRRMSHRRHEIGAR